MHPDEKGDIQSGTHLGITAFPWVSTQCGPHRSSETQNSGKWETGAHELCSNGGPKGESPRRSSYPRVFRDTGDGNRGEGPVSRRHPVKALEAISRPMGPAEVCRTLLWWVAKHFCMRKKAKTARTASQDKNTDFPTGSETVHRSPSQTLSGYGTTFHHLKKQPLPLVKQCQRTASVPQGCEHVPIPTTRI